MALGIQWANGDQDVRCSWSLTCAITHILKNTMLEARSFLKQRWANVKKYYHSKSRKWGTNTVLNCYRIWQCIIVVDPAVYR